MIDFLTLMFLPHKALNVLLCETFKIVDHCKWFIKVLKYMINIESFAYMTTLVFLLFEKIVLVISLLFVLCIALEARTFP